MLNENLKKYREMAGYSRERLGQKINKSARCIENIENKKTKNPQIDTLKDICKVLNISIEKLIK